MSPFWILLEQQRWTWWWQLEDVQDSKLSPTTYQHPAIYRPDALPVTQPTVSGTEGKMITFHILPHPKLTWGFSIRVLTIKGSWLPWGRAAKIHVNPLTANLYVIYTQRSSYSFSAATLLFGHQEEHPACVKLGAGLLVMTIWLELCTSYGSSC